MSDPISRDQLVEAGLDADSLANVVNGPSGTTVTTRTGRVLRVLADAGTLSLDNLALTQAAIPDTAPTLTASASSGNPTGTVAGAVSFVTALGETDPGPISNVLVTGGKQILWSGIPLGPTGTTARKLWRNKSTAGDVRDMELAATISDNVTTTYTDNKADGDLGVEVPYVNTTGGVFTVGGKTFIWAGAQGLGIGFGAFATGNGYANTFVGNFSGNVTQTARRNSGFGQYSLKSLTIGNDNDASGVHSLGSLVSGNDNSVHGYAGALNATSSSRLALVGAYAMSGALTATDCAGGGFQVMFSTIDGSNNAVFGTRGLYTAVHSSNVSALGDQVLYGATGNNYAAVGFQAGYTGPGDGAVLLGFQAGYYETLSNKLFIDNNSRSDATDARIKALVHGQFSALSTPYSTQFLNVNGGFQVRASATQSVGDLYVDPANRAIHFGGLSSTGGDEFSYFQVRGRTGTVHLKVDVANSIVALPSIGTTATAANAFIDSANSNKILRSTSSQIYKTNVKSVQPDDADTKVKALRAVLYQSNAKSDDPDVVHFGLIAEEVAKVSPSLVTFVPMRSLDENDPRIANDDAPDWLKMVADGVQYERVCVLLIAAHQKLSNEVNEMKAQMKRAA